MRYDRDEAGNSFPPDLEKTDAASASTASQTSKDSYTKKITLALVKDKRYKFWFTYKHQDPDTKEIKESDRSPIWTESFAIPNLTKAVQNLTLTAGVQSYGVKFTLDPLSVQQDVVIFESLTSNFASQSVVYEGTSTNVSILTTGATAFSPRWVKVRSRDKWDDLTNISEVTAGPVTPIDPIAAAIDVTPPDEVTITSAQWVTTGLTEEIQIAYTIPNNGGSEFQIFLTNGLKTRSISEYPTNTGSSQIARISKVQLEALFGVGYPTSFTGLFKSLDKAKNPSAGTPFAVTAKGNALVGVTPTATATAMINGFSISWDLGSAKTAKVYTSTTSGFTPNESVAPQYYGAGPYIQNTSLTSGFATVYFKVKFFGDTTTDFSGFSVEGSVTPINPDTTDATPPPTITSVTGVGASNTDDPSGISGQVTLTIIQPTMPADFAGYSVKIINGAQTWYQEFPSTTALGTLVVKNGIYIGQSYSLSVATRDKTNLQSYISCSNNPIAINDTRANTSAVTNLTVSATDSIATASWTAPIDNKVGSYKVMITSNADTTFASPTQTIFTDSTQTSFGGLTAATAYRIRVTTRYSNNGALSTQNTDVTFTLNSSGAISDGAAPTANPLITDSMVKSLFGAFAITFPPVTNPDDVKYEVFIKPTNATGIVDNQYKVLEVGGTFAVLKTLADRTTALSYGTNYYIAVRAKDNDGVSTGTITAVGPVQTLQVSNADLAADSVYANNIKAGEIDASKMVTDLLFAEKTINVGESTSLNRIRLDAVTIPAGTAGYTNPSAAIKSRIFIGAGTYNNSGTAFYADNLGRFSLKDKLQFDGNNLQIDANGSFGGLLTAGPTGQEIKIGLAAGGGTNHGIYFAATSDFLYNSGNFRLGAGKITYDGTLLNIASQVNITGSSTITGNFGVTTGTLYAGASATDGNRVVMNSGGLFGYNGATINFSFPNSTGRFALGSGDISGWSVSSGNIEKSTTVGATTTYSGMSAGDGTSTSALAFYAGGGSAGSGSPSFKVTHGGVMTASGVVIKNGQLDIGVDWPTGGFHVDSSGILKAKGATIAGALSIEGGSTFAGNIEVTSGGTIFMGSSNASTNRVVLTSAGIAGYAAAASIFSLNTSGTGTIGGWAFDSTKLSSSGMTLDSSDQTISFKQGFIMDNDTVSVPVVSSTPSAGSSSAELDTPESEYSSFASGSNSSASSTFAIKLPTQNTTNSPKFVMTRDATSGSSILLSNYGNSSFSSIQLANGGVDINLGRTGAITLRGFTAKAHYSYGTGTSGSGTIVPAMLMIKPDGTVSSGRSIFKSGTSETSINNGSHNHVGLIGDIILSTQD